MSGTARVYTEEERAAVREREERAAYGEPEAGEPMSEETGRELIAAVNRLTIAVIQLRRALEGRG